MKKEIKVIKSPKVLLVADIRGHAFDHVAAGVGTFLTTEVLYSDEFKSTAGLVEAIRRSSSDVVHFFWRKKLEELLWLYGQDFRRRIGNKKISFAVPDHLFLEARELIGSEDLFKIADGYSVTSDLLWDIYTNQDLVKKPLAIIPDYVNLSPSSRIRAASAAGRPMHVIWVGNSSWGEWSGAEDHKGLREIVTPGVGHARSLGADIKLEIIDTAFERLPHSEVLSRMLNADVILQTSKNEGTGLPLIEAMSTGAIPVSTRVGVAENLMIGRLNQFLIERNPVSLGNALLHLYNEKNSWPELSSQALSSVSNFYGGNRVQKSWENYLSKVTATPNAPQKNYLPAKAHWLLRFVNSGKFVLALATFAFKKFSLVRKLHAHLVNADHLNKLRKETRLHDSKPVDTLAVFNPNWHGITASTKQIFLNCMPVPLEKGLAGTSKELIIEYAEAISKKVNKKVVFSGGDDFHRDLALKVSEIRPDLEIRVLWHGSSTLFSSGNEGYHFSRWLKLAKDRKINGLDVLKSGMEKFVRAQGVDSSLFENSIFETKLEFAKYKYSQLDGKIHIGVLASSTAFWKNLDTQILAALLIPNSVVHVLGLTEDSYLWEFVEKSKIVNHIGPLVHDDFLALMSRLDVISYVTITEASPMIPLEAMSLGIPVLIGTSTIFENYPACLEAFRCQTVDHIPQMRDALEKVISESDFVSREQMVFLSSKAKNFNQI